MKWIANPASCLQLSGGWRALVPPLHSQPGASGRAALQLSPDQASRRAMRRAARQPAGCGQACLSVAHTQAAPPLPLRLHARRLSNRQSPSPHRSPCAHRCRS
jgi:hypothetical protein